MFDAAGHSPELAALEASYFGILILGTLPRGLALALGQFLIAVDRPNWVFGATVIGIAANVVLNYGLIFGELGMPQMGLAGAAWATNAAAVVEALVLFAVVARPSFRRFGVRDWRLRPAYMGKLLRLGLPSGLQFLADIVPWTLFFGYVMVRFGEEAMAANGFAFRYQVTAFLPALGISVAMTALVGRYIGRGQPQVARQRAHLGYGLIACWSLFMAACYIFLGRPLMMIFTSDPAVLDLGVSLLVVVGGFQFFDSMYIAYASALARGRRHAGAGAGDVRVLLADAHGGGAARRPRRCRG